jgi:hypothetical protein
VVAIFVGMVSPFARSRFIIREKDAQNAILSGGVADDQSQLVDNAMNRIAESQFKAKAV